jgi:hypothetical protein
MKRLWLVFSQAVTVLLAVWFVLITLKPEWLQSGSSWNGGLQVFEAPASLANTTSRRRMKRGSSPAASILASQ